MLWCCDAGSTLSYPEAANLRTIDLASNQLKDRSGAQKLISQKMRKTDNPCHIINVLCRMFSLVWIDNQYTIDEEYCPITEGLASKHSPMEQPGTWWDVEESCLQSKKTAPVSRHEDTDPRPKERKECFFKCCLCFCFLCCLAILRALQVCNRFLAATMPLLNCLHPSRASLKP